MSAAKRKLTPRERWERHRQTILSGGEDVRRLAWTALGGICIFLSFPFQTVPATNLWPLAWVGLVPFLWALRPRSDGRALTGAQGFWIGAWMGFVTNFGGFWWVSEVLSNFGHLPWFVSWPLTALNSFYQGLMFAFVGLWFVKAQRHGPVPIWKTAAIFTVVEWLFPMIFPWFLSNGQYRFLEAIQIAELGGVMSITFVMVAFNAAVFALVDHRVRKAPLPRRAAIITFAATAAVIVYGAIRVPMVDADVRAAEKIRLGLVEADIGIFEKQAKHLPPEQQALVLHKNLLRHQRMSAEVAAAGADLVIWPESSYFPLDDPFIKRLDQFAIGLTDQGTVRVATDPGDGPDVLTWGPEPKPTSAAPLAAVTALREDEWAAVGRGGAMVVSGRAVASGTREDLFGVAMIEKAGYEHGEDGVPYMIVVAGARGTLVRWEDGRAEPLDSGVTKTLRAVALGPGRTGWIVGDGGVVLRLDGGKVSRMDLETSADLTAVWMSPDGAGTLVAGKGGFLAFIGNDGRLAPQTLPGPDARRDLVAIAADRLGVLHVAGQGGVFARQNGAWALDDAAPKDVVALSTDARGSLMAVTAAGEVRRKLAGVWQRMPVVSAERMVAVAPLPYVQVRPLPRDVRHMLQGVTPLPTGEIAKIDPLPDIRNVPMAERSGVQRGFTAPLLFGGLTWDIPPPTSESRRRILYNTAILIDELGRVRGTYDKVFLLAFGEFMPFGEQFPWLYDAFPNAGRFTPGTEVKAFHWRGHTLGIMVCYEDIMAGFTSKLADLDPHIIINVTNDAWFGRTSEPYLHLALAIFRSIENRRMLVRSTNTGVTALIDPTGRIVAETRIDDPEVIVADAPLLTGKTLYAAVGDLFVWLVFGALVAEGVWAWWRRRRARGAVGLQERSAT